MCLVKQGKGCAGWRKKKQISHYVRTDIHFIAAESNEWSGPMRCVRLLFAVVNRDC